MNPYTRMEFGNRFLHARFKDEKGDPIVCVVTEVRHELICWRRVGGHTVGVFEQNHIARHVQEIL